MPNVEKTISLAACPFCRGQAVYMQVYDFNDDNYGGLFIECSQCKISTPLKFPCKEPAEEALKELWNTRSDSGWIPIANPPHNERPVLIQYWDERIFLAFYMKNLRGEYGWFEYITTEPLGREPKAWMELPAPFLCA